MVGFSLLFGAELINNWLKSLKNPKGCFTFISLKKSGTTSLIENRFSNEYPKPEGASVLSFTTHILPSGPLAKSAECINNCLAVL